MFGFKSIIILVISLTLHSQLYALDGGVCRFIFDTKPSEHSLFQQIESLEEQYKNLLMFATTSYGKVKTSNDQKTLDQVVEMIQTNQKKLDLATNKVLEGHSVESFKTLLMVETNSRLLNDRIQSVLTTKPTQEQAHTWSDYIQHPEMLQAYKLYKVPSESEAPIHIKFSDRVLKDLFHSNQPLNQSAAKKMLKAMTRYVGNTDSSSSGLVELKSHKGVYEVRIIGHALGAIRLAGVKYNGVIHFSHIDKHGNHNATFSNHLVSGALSKFQHDF